MIFIPNSSNQRFWILCDFDYKIWVPLKSIYQWKITVPFNLLKDECVSLFIFESRNIRTNYKQVFLLASNKNCHFYLYHNCCLKLRRCLGTRTSLLMPRVNHFISPLLVAIHLLTAAIMVKFFFPRNTLGGTHLEQLNFTQLLTPGADGGTVAPTVCRTEHGVDTKIMNLKHGMLHIFPWLIMVFWKLPRMINTHKCVFKCKFGTPWKTFLIGKYQNIIM